LGRHSPLVDALPRDLPGLVGAVQGLLIHEYMAPAYGVAVPDERRGESHIRHVERMLDRLLELDGRPLSIARPPEPPLVGVCRHYPVLLAAILRARRLPARARCGFGTYFTADTFEDHWVCELWDEGEARWVLVDAQLDEVWREQLEPDFGPLDVPRDRFLVAGDAWAKCRAGEADSRKFGIFKGNLRGFWFIAGSLVRDLAALNKVEMLAWDVWGAMPLQGRRISRADLALFDQLAQLTRAPDAAWPELRSLYEQDERLHVPPTVFNALLNRPETV